VNFYPGIPHRQARHAVQTWKMFVQPYLRGYKYTMINVQVNTLINQ
jgi:hypothetical protein